MKRTFFLLILPIFSTTRLHLSQRPLQTSVLNTLDMGIFYLSLPRWNHHLPAGPVDVHRKHDSGLARLCKGSKTIIPNLPHTAPPVVPLDITLQLAVMLIVNLILLSRSLFLFLFNF